MKQFITMILSSLAFSVAAQGYVVSSDSQPVRDSSGQCVRTAFWTPADRKPPCDPAPVTVTTAFLSADVLFGFDKSELTHQGRSELYKVAKAITSGSRVTVTGHADWIGNPAYNQTLSERRARAVADYLQTQVSAVYTVTGMGSTDPLPSTESCKGQKNFKKLVACLAPDRRVEIDYLPVK
jgi:OmpA-OmpF porin, OOP family